MSQIRLLFFLFIILSLLSISLLLLKNKADEVTEDEKLIFKYWKNKYHKEYSSQEEEQYRFQVKFEKSK
jgi:hypothetical protein